MSTAQINAWLEAAHEDVGRLLAPTSDGHEHRPAIVHATHRLYDARPALPGAQDFDSDRISSSGSHSNLPAPMALGRWCYDFVNRNNRLPKQNECERHDRGQVIRLPA
jgi:hypothetical protein